MQQFFLVHIYLVDPKRIDFNELDLENDSQIFSSCFFSKRKSDIMSDEDDVVEYEVEEILDHMLAPDGTDHYLVHWKGFPDNENTWEPYESLREHCLKTIINYNKTIHQEEKQYAADVQKIKKGLKSYIPISKKYSQNPESINISANAQQESQNAAQVISSSSSSSEFFEDSSLSDEEKVSTDDAPYMETGIDRHQRKLDSLENKKFLMSMEKGKKPTPKAHVTDDDESDQEVKVIGSSHISPPIKPKEITLKPQEVLFDSGDLFEDSQIASEAEDFDTFAQKFIENENKNPEYGDDMKNLKMYPPEIVFSCKAEFGVIRYYVYSKTQIYDVSADALKAYNPQLILNFLENKIIFR